jgi:uroporphyrinogen-III decarboxylase
MVYVEGSYNTRLNYLTEVPKGKVVYLFETTDMREAKKVLKDTACIAGNVPNAMLTWGTPQEVSDYCKGLIDICAPGGGYMMDSGALIDEAKPENVTAMFETTMTYGKY